MGARVHYSIFNLAIFAFPSPITATQTPPSCAPTVTGTFYLRSFPSTTSIMKSLHRSSPSDITLAPGTDGGSDYHQYLEKNSRRSSRGNASIVHSSTTGDGEILSRNTLVNTPAPTVNDDPRPQLPSTPTFERIRCTPTPTQRKQRPQRLEVDEDAHEYPGPLALSLLTIGICLSVFLVSLDRTIVATVSALYKSVLSKRPN